MYRRQTLADRRFNDVPGIGHGATHNEDLRAEPQQERAHGLAKGSKGAPKDCHGHGVAGPIRLRYGVPASGTSAA
jgi:hypothetical protein